MKEESNIMSMSNSSHCFLSTGKCQRVGCFTPRSDSCLTVMTVPVSGKRLRTIAISCLTFKPSSLDSKHPVVDQEEQNNDV